MHINEYSQKGCIGCKPCEGGIGNIIRGLVLMIPIFWFIIPLSRKCMYCGHKRLLNNHHGPDPRT